MGWTPTVPDHPDACILILNYNGRDLLAECLPSIVEAARQSPASCPVAVIDNDSRDDSLSYLHEHWPNIEIHREPNRGLASFNAVLERRREPVALLLNNDVKLDPGAVGPLLQALNGDPDAFFAAPLCWDFDGETYEGMRTLVRWRFGLPQGMSRTPDHREALGRPDLTAAAGPILAVDRAKFLALGGYDPLYFPGRIEDLDLGFRAWMAGWRGHYVPESVAYHKGFGSFAPAFGASGCDRLAARNSFLFAWKNLGGRRLASSLAWLPPRLLLAAARGRWPICRATFEALARLPDALAVRRAQGTGRGDWNARQEAFFERFAW